MAVCQRPRGAAEQGRRERGAQGEASLITEYRCCGQPMQELRTGEGRWLGCAVCKLAGYEGKLPKSDAEARALGLAGLLIRAGFKARVRIRRGPAFWNGDVVVRPGTVSATVSATAPHAGADSYLFTYASTLPAGGHRASTRYVDGTLVRVQGRNKSLSQAQLGAAVRREVRLAQVSGRIAAAVTRQPEIRGAGWAHNGESPLSGPAQVPGG
jgi:hypothetical protein